MNFNKKLSLLPALKQALPVILDQGIASVANFLIGALCARAVDKASYSMFILGNSIILIIIGFERALITTPFAILLPGKKEYEESSYIGDICLFHGIFVGTTLLIFLGTEAFFWQKNPFFSDTPVAWAILFSTVGLSFYYFLKYLLLARMQNSWNLAFGITCNGLMLTSTLFLYINKALGIKSVFFLSGTVNILLSIFFFWPLLRITKFRLLDFRANLKRHWQLGKWIVGSNVAFIISSQMFPWLIAIFATQEDVANFGVAMGVTRIFTPLTQGFASYLLPKLSHTRSSKMSFSGIVRSTTAAAVIFSILLLLIGSLWGEQLCSLLYSQKYSGLGILLLVSFAIQGLNIINIPIDAALNALKRTDLGFKSLVFSSIFALLLGVPLTKEFGVLGACLGSLVAVVGGLVYRASAMIAVMKKADQ